MMGCGRTLRRSSCDRARSVSSSPISRSRSAGVRVADLLDLLEGRLQLTDAPGQPGVLLAEALGRWLGSASERVAHVPEEHVTNVSLRKRLVATPRIGPISP